MVSGGGKRGGTVNYTIYDLANQPHTVRLLDTWSHCLSPIKIINGFVFDMWTVWCVYEW